MIVPGWPWRLLILLACALAAHVLLSPLGFNPTDDGFVLAQSRRILEGEVPHRDFISIRPAGSALLHAAELAIGGDHAFLLSRSVYWMQVAVACWCWLEVALARARAGASALVPLPLAAVAFMLSTHTFPPMAWHSVDAILLASAGFMLAGTGGRTLGLVGYAAIGAAAVCKQNFLPLLPLAVLVLGDARRLSAWAAVSGVPLLYVAVLASLGAGRDMVSQLTAVADLDRSGLRPYLNQPWLLGGAALGAALAVAAGVRTPRTAWRSTALRWAVPALGGLLIVLAGRRLAAGGNVFLDEDAFLPFGAVAGAVPVWLARAGSRRLGLAALFAVALAWCSAISLGYRTPAHVAGPLAILLAIGSLGTTAPGTRTGARSPWFACALLALVVLAPRWWAARREHIYRERPAPELRHDLAGVLPGARGIRTDPETRAMLLELREATDRLGQRPYAILVDAPAWWARAKRRNPLCADWPRSAELPTATIERRFLADLTEHLERGGVAIVQKASAELVSEQFAPIGAGQRQYDVATAVMATRRLESEGRYWAVYR